MIVRRLIPIMFFVAACSPGATPPGATPPPSASGDDPIVETTAGVEETPQDTTPATSAQSSTETTISDRPVAPDFTLPLAGGGAYTLSETDKPVYLIFWAEW